MHYLLMMVLMMHALLWRNLYSVETALSNRFDSLTDQIKDLLHMSSDIKTSHMEIQDLHESTSSLSAKITDLCSQNETFQEMSATSGANDIASAFGVVDEIADHEQRKRNIIVYNFPKKPDRAADKGKFTEMCKEITDAELKISKLFRLGKRVENKHRPLLIGLETDEDRACLLSVAPQLRLSTECLLLWI